MSDPAPPRRSSRHPAPSPRFRRRPAAQPAAPSAGGAGRGSAVLVPATTAPASVGGYRVVRRLGGGATATVLLARGDERSVALRCYRDGVHDARIDAEVECLSRLRSRHLVALRDLATGTDGRVVPVLDAVVGPSLDDLLAARNGALDPGEAVTVLVPLAELLQELHEVGVVVGRWNPAGVRIGADGAPVLTALSGLVAAPPLPQRFRRQEPGILADLAGLRSLGEQVVGAVRSGRRDALLDALGSVEDPLALERALFDAARPAPLVLELAVPERAVDRSPRAVGAGGDRVESTGPAAEPPEPSSTSGLRATVLRVLDDLGLPPALIDPLRGSPRPTAATRRPGPRRRAAAASSERSAAAPGGRDRTSRRSATARPRRSVVLVGAGGGLALLAAIALLALDGDDPGSASPPSVSPSSSSTVEAPAGPEGDADGAMSGASASDDAAPEGTSSPAEAGAGSASADSGAEPPPEEWIGLVIELAARWSACRTEVLAGGDQERCASGVVQPGSAAAEQLAAPTGTAADGVLSPAPSEAVVVDRLGSAALIDLIDEAGTRTASLLVMRSEAGWRIRSVLD